MSAKMHASIKERPMSAQDRESSPQPAEPHGAFGERFKPKYSDPAAKHPTEEGLRNIPKGITPRGSINPRTDYLKKEG
jgi:hypothetical protein